MNRLRLAALLLLAAAAGTARAESPRLGSFQFQMSSYRPNIDAEFKGRLGCGGGTVDCTPYQDIFGGGSSWIYELQVAGSLYVGTPGTLDLGVGVGYFSETGKGLIQGTLTPSGDDTAFRVVPLSLSLTWRFDGFATSFPLVPYARASLLRYQWWITNGSGGTASAPGVGSGSGGTWGWGVAGGVAFLLDFLDPQLGREMDRDVGINHTYLFLEASHDKVDDFGSKKSWDLSNDRSLTWSGGILFVF